MTEQCGGHCEQDAFVGNNSAVQVAAQKHVRFRVSLTTEETQKQRVDRDKVLRLVTLPAFEAHTEEQLEHWADKVAGTVSRNRLCVELFREAWMTVCSQAVAQAIDYVPVVETHEALIDEVAKSLFPYSRYVKKVENQLLTGCRANTVMEATHWLQTTAARYLRLCKRHQWDIGISNCRFIDSLLVSLPQVIEQKVKDHVDVYTAEAILQKARKFEADMVEHQLPEPVTAMPARTFNNPLLDDDSMADNMSKARAARLAHYVCKSCGAVGQHFRNQCQYL